MLQKEQKKIKREKYEENNKRRNPELKDMGFQIKTAHGNSSPGHFMMKLQKFADKEDPKRFKTGKRKNRSWHRMGLFPSNISSNAREQRRHFFNIQRQTDF